MKNCCIELPKGKYKKYHNHFISKDILSFCERDFIIETIIVYDDFFRLELKMLDYFRDSHPKE